MTDKFRSKTLYTTEEYEDMGGTSVKVISPDGMVVGAYPIDQFNELYELVPEETPAQ